MECLLCYPDSLAGFFGRRGEREKRKWREDNGWGGIGPDLVWKKIDTPGTDLFWIVNNNVSFGEI